MKKIIPILLLIASCFGQQIVYGYRSFTTGQGIAEQFPNAASTGTTLASLAKKTGAGAIILATTDTNVGSGVFIVVGRAGIASANANADLAVSGQAYCTFAVAPSAVGDFVIASTSTGGDCADAGATKPGGVNVVGTVDSLTAVGSTYLVTVNTDFSSTAFVPSATVGQDGFWDTGVSATGILGGVASATVTGSVFNVAQVVLTRPYVVGHSTFYTTTTNSATLNTCIYNNAATPALVLSWQAVLSVGQQTASTTQVTLPAGVYWAGAYATGGNPVIWTYNITSNIAHIANTNGNRVATATWSGSTCPSTLTGITANNGLAQFPAVLFEP